MIDSPIGVFDSGVGGLTVARTIVDQAPTESIMYVGDTAHAPYGPKSPEDVVHYSMSIADDLVARGAKMIVIACNTASSVFLERARELYDVPVIGVIEPASRRAVAATRSGRVGIIGTTGTIASGSYQRAIAEMDPDVEVHAVDCPQFVPFVERGITTGRQVMGLAEAYLEPLHDAGVDTLVLGCTHYPLLTGVIQLVMGDSVTLVSSSEEEGKEVARVLYQENLCNNAVSEVGSDGVFDASVVNEFVGPDPVYRFESTGDPHRFARLARRFLGPSIAQVSHVPGGMGR
ncbi:glutamate racemase [Corynebacterium kroppenstedtii]|uniref:glutamate racemase n=1 Tax=Corynebacterium sp. PCR 32 TaxID=3351342 RepID=UPI0030A419EC